MQSFVSRLASGLVTVEHQLHHTCTALAHQRGVILRGRRAQDCGHEVDAHLVCGHHVGVAFHQRHAATTAHIRQGAIPGVDQTPLLEKLGFGRVDVLGA